MEMNQAQAYLTAIGGVKRVMAVRLKPKSDMLKSLEDACREHGIQNGVIMSGIGGVTTAVFCDPQYFPCRTQPYNYGDPIVKHEVLSIAAISGIICHDPAGEINLHVHVTFSDQQGRCYAGHLKEGTITMLTVDCVIAEVGDGLVMSRQFDPELEVPLFTPVQE